MRTNLENTPNPPRDRAAINRANALKSTGPRTAAGKNRSRLNAMRHGLAGRTVVLPSDDLAAYKNFTDAFIAALCPETPIERQLAQSIADTHWRLNRAVAYEHGMLSLGQLQYEGNIDADDPEVLAALTAAAAYQENQKAFINLTIYEQRLHRIASGNFKELQELQAQRREQAASAPNEAIETPDEKQVAAANGFVYANAQTEQLQELDAQRRERAANALNEPIETPEEKKVAAANGFVYASSQSSSPMDSLIEHELTQPQAPLVDASYCTNSRNLLSFSE